MNVKHCIRAAHMASMSTEKFRLGAVLARGKDVIGVGYNVGRTHPRMQRFNPDKSYSPGLHAEVSACMGVDDRQLIGADLYVVRLSKAGKWTMAKPCEICQKFLTDVGIKRVYYSNKVGEMEQL
jgi:deoxycytidylate deaminase